MYLWFEHCKPFVPYVFRCFITMLYIWIICPLFIEVCHFYIAYSEDNFCSIYSSMLVLCSIFGSFVSYVLKSLSSVLYIGNISEVGHCNIPFLLLKCKNYFDLLFTYLTLIFHNRKNSSIVLLSIASYFYLLLLVNVMSRHLKDYSQGFQKLGLNQGYF